MKVGTVVKLRVDCLDNKAGTLGVVFYDYGDGCQAIFENGNLDGFHTKPEESCPPFWPNKIEFDYFLETAGFEPSLADYQFKSVIQVSRDFTNGVFNIVWKKSKMTAQDKELFQHVCFAILMQHDSAGICTKSPKYIKEKISLLKNGGPLAAWQSLDYGNRALLLDWADSWKIPVRDWIEELGGEI